MLELIKKSLLQTFNINVIILGLIFQGIIFIYWNLLGANLLALLRDISIGNIVIADELPLIYFYIQQSSFWVLFFILSMIALFFATIIQFIYSNYANGSSLKEATKVTFSKIKHCAALVVLVFSIQILMLSANIIMFGLPAALHAIISIIIIILVLYLFFRFSLIIPILALERRRLKKGLQKAWHFSKGNLTKIGIVFLALMIFGMAISMFSDFLQWLYAILGLEIYVEVLDLDLLVEFTDAVLNSFVIGFMPIALTNLYLELKDKITFK